ncbi:hypothetical protein RHGRI_005966 [Rhododendron griersonianum]|uniref:glucose-6-phosphate 1-epimerase n=1 Tax=Rhododendron griersonianum TaxID=479676 RepID=A0AAV6LGG3_9ERIC|nr:hypothetical protein RHGRI_005966 [Rhododendron griersonianum]
MHSRASSNRLSSGSSFRSRVSTLLLSMFATMASLYVAGRLWQDAQNRVHLIEELDKRTGQGQSAISVDDTLKIITCREQQKKLTALEMELAKARQKGFVSKHSSDGSVLIENLKHAGAALEKLQDEKGIVVRFVIGRSTNPGDGSDREIDNENGQSNDFIILKDHIEATKEEPKKTKLFITHAVEKWDAEFYAKVNDDIYVNIDALGASLSNHLDKPRVYIGCMKSGEVFSEQTHQWYEPEWWKFGDKKSYFRHASGELYAISRALAQFIAINRSILRIYAHDDVSAGSWFIGLDVNHVDEAKFCCSSWSSENIAGEQRAGVEITKDKNGIEQVSLHGGQVLSWKTDRGEELLFTSSKFGNRGALEQHGFARNKIWVIDSNPPPLHRNDSDGKSYIDLLLKPSQEDLKVWPHSFEFRLRVALAADGYLTMISRIRNINSKPFSFSFAYHTYFSVSDISEVRVEGLETRDYLDNLYQRERFTEQGDALTFESEVDRVYLNTTNIVAVFDHEIKRTVVIRKEGLPDVVVWNPWEKKSKLLLDFGDEEYKHMLCVDGAAIEKPITLKPGEEWTGRLELSVVPST